MAALPRREFIKLSGKGPALIAVEFSLKKFQHINLCQ